MLFSNTLKDSIATFLTSTIDQLKKMNHTLMAYTSQMFQVVTNSVTVAPTDVNFKEFHSFIADQQRIYFF